MAFIDTSQITALIAEFSALTAKDSITPATLGYILNRLAGLIALAADHRLTQEEIDGVAATANNALIEKIEFISITDSAALGITQGGAHKQVSIPKADEEHAGLMCGHQYKQLQELYEKKTEWSAATTTANNALLIAQAAQNTGATTPCFSGIMVDTVSESELIRGSSTSGSTDPGCAVVYDRSGGRFLLRTGVAGSFKYYLNWVDALKMGMTQAAPDSEQAGCYIPKPGVMYRATFSPFGLYCFDTDGAPHLLDGTQVGDQVNIEVLSQEAYDALSDDEVRADTLYFVTEDAESA